MTSPPLTPTALVVAHEGGSLVFRRPQQVVTVTATTVSVERELGFTRRWSLPRDEFVAVGRGQRAPRRSWSDNTRVLYRQVLR